MQCYAGFENGRLILTKGFAESLTRAGFPPKPEIVARARAMDSAAAIVDDEPDEDGALNLALNLAYARLLRGDNADSGANLDETFAGVAPLSNDFEDTRASDSWPWNLRRIHIGRSSKRSETVHRIPCGKRVGR